MPDTATSGRSVGFARCWRSRVLASTRLNRPISIRASHDAKLVTAIETSFRTSDRTYGARRVWRDVLEEGLACGLHRIKRLMRLNALRARPRRRGKPKDDGERSVIADNILDRDFQADRPNQKWLTVCGLKSLELNATRPERRRREGEPVPIAPDSDETRPAFLHNVCSAFRHASAQALGV
ncbi:IS3 family transposase (plasmid) [Gluconobacter thailandicus]|uniref:IS3 family transposase n=1 Tax=Gluconobacter thailandicus TaxID=257438 RepID=A0AAP9JJC0_GLUTH|nr:IS3 family transposase [Gluconobacter thailandicus]